MDKVDGHKFELHIKLLFGMVVREEYYEYRTANIAYLIVTTSVKTGLQITFISTVAVKIPNLWLMRRQIIESCSTQPWTCKILIKLIPAPTLHAKLTSCRSLKRSNVNVSGEVNLMERIYEAKIT